MRPGVHPVVQIAVGVAAGVALLALVRCTSSGQLTPRMACRLDALKVLPNDPMMVTVYDAVDVVQRIRACDFEGEDGGAP